MHNNRHIFIKFNEANEDFPEISTIREHELVGLENEEEVIWGQFTSRNQADISKKPKEEIQEQLRSGVLTKVFFYSRKAGLLYEADLINIYKRDDYRVIEENFIDLIPEYYRYLVGETHLTAQTPKIIYTYLHISGLKPISLKQNIDFIYHYDKKEPILAIGGMQALLYVSLEEGYKKVEIKKEIKGKKLILNKDKGISKNNRSSSTRERVGRKIDHTANHKTKQKIGLGSEELVLEYEKERLRKAGKLELAEQVEHKSVTEGDGLGYDILSFNDDGTKKYIEVKGTNDTKNKEFPISENEVRFSEENKESFYIYRVYDYNSAEPQLKIYPGSVSEIFNLTPIKYSGSLK